MTFPIIIITRCSEFWFSPSFLSCQHQWSSQLQSRVRVKSIPVMEGSGCMPLNSPFLYSTKMFFLLPSSWQTQKCWDHSKENWRNHPLDNCLKKYKQKRTKIVLNSKVIFVILSMEFMLYPKWPDYRLWLIVCSEYLNPFFLLLCFTEIYRLASWKIDSKERS